MKTRSYWDWLWNFSRIRLSRNKQHYTWKDYRVLDIEGRRDTDAQILELYFKDSPEADRYVADHTALTKHIGHPLNKSRFVNDLLKYLKSNRITHNQYYLLHNVVTISTDEIIKEYLNENNIEPIIKQWCLHKASKKI